MAMNSVDSSKGRLRGTYIAIMIPLGVAINYVGGQIATSLGLPIYLDSIGTIIVASIMGPWIGATSGVLYNIISSLVQGNIMASLFGLCNIGSGLIVGYMARYGKYKNIFARHNRHGSCVAVELYCCGAHRDGGIWRHRRQRGHQPDDCGLPGAWHRPCKRSLPGAHPCEPGG